MQNENPVFADAKGSEANQHAKKIAQQKSKKKETNSHFFFSQKGHKVLKLIVKPGKVHSIYIGSLLKKKEKQLLTSSIEKWKKDKLWVNEHDVHDKVQEIFKLLAEKK